MILIQKYRKLFKNRNRNRHYFFLATNGTNQHELFVPVDFIRGKVAIYICIANPWNHFGQLLKNHSKIIQTASSFIE